MLLDFKGGRIPAPQAVLKDGLPTVRPSSFPRGAKISKFPKRKRGTFENSPFLPKMPKRILNFVEGVSL